jgi:uncharacterized protein YjbJ (UPF0337 family)
VVGASLLAGAVVLSSQWFSESLRPAESTTASPLAERRAFPPMNEEQFEGKWKQVKGEVKRQWGEFTDNHLLQIEGSHDKFVGELLERYGDRKEDVRRLTEEWMDLEKQK